MIYFIFLKDGRQAGILRSKSQNLEILDLKIAIFGILGSLLENVKNGDFENLSIWFSNDIFVIFGAIFGHFWGFWETYGQF